jgi:hypothetical protein
MNLNEIIIKLDHGDNIADDELVFAIKELDKACKVLGDLNYKPYWLMYIDMCHKKSTLEQYRDARKDRR